MADALRMLGLARRAGAVVPGSAAARRSIRGGGAHLVVMAADAARQQLDKVESAAGRRGVPTVSVADRVTLGAAVGRGPITALAVTDSGFADRLRLGLPCGDTKSGTPGAGYSTRNLGGGC